MISNLEEKLGSNFPFKLYRSKRSLLGKRKYTILNIEDKAYLIEQYYSRKCRLIDLAEELDINYSTCKRILKYYRETGQVGEFRSSREKLEAYINTREPRLACNLQVARQWPKCRILQDIVPHSEGEFNVPQSDKVVCLKGEVEEGASEKAFPKNNYLPIGKGANVQNYPMRNVVRDPFLGRNHKPPLLPPLSTALLSSHLNPPTPTPSSIHKNPHTQIFNFPFYIQAIHLVNIQQRMYYYFNGASPSV